jgi:hypothetical protein
MARNSAGHAVAVAEYFGVRDNTVHFEGHRRRGLEDKKDMATSLRGRITAGTRKQCVQSRSKSRRASAHTHPQAHKLLMRMDHQELDDNTICSSVTKTLTTNRKHGSFPETPTCSRPLRMLGIPV